MADSTHDTERWQKFGRWLQEQRVAEPFVDSTEAGHLVGITGQQWRHVIERGLIALDRPSVIRLAEVLLADVNEACRQAGYSPPESYVHIPVMLYQLNYLPIEVQRDIAAQIDALYQTYTRDAQETAAENMIDVTFYLASVQLDVDVKEKIVDRWTELKAAELREALETIETPTENDIQEEDTVA